MWILLHPPAQIALFPLQSHALVAEEVGGQTEEEEVVREVLWFRLQPYQLLRISASLWGRVEVLLFSMTIRVLLLQVRAPKFHSLVSLFLLPVADQAAEDSILNWGRIAEERAGRVEGVVVATTTLASAQPVVKASKAVPAARAMMMVASQLVLEEEALGKQGQVEVTVWREMVVTDISYPLARSCQNLLQAGVLER